jgi:hypothetical protein
VWAVWGGVGLVGWGWGGVGWGGGVVVQSDGPRPPRRRHRGGTPVVVSSETPERLQQRDDAAGGREGRALHRGGSDGDSCVRCDRQQVSLSAGGLSNRLVGRCEA